MQQVIYKPGDLHLQSFITQEGKVAYTDLTIDEYLAKHPDHKVMSFDRASEMIDFAHGKLCGSWKEIDRERFFEMMDVIPPTNWETGGNLEIFQISETYSGGITSTFIRIDGRHFEALRPIGIKISEIDLPDL